MTSYLQTNIKGEIYFPFDTENDVVEMVWTNNQSGNRYEVNILKSSLSTFRGWSALIIVTGTESTPYYELDVENFTTTLHIPSGDYTAVCNENDINRIAMIHVIKDNEHTIYQNEQNNVIYNG